MICPVCSADYRPGFHRCADCDVALVESPCDAGRVETPATDKYGALLWRGGDPLFYLSLVGWLGQDPACYGRPQRAPLATSDRGLAVESEPGGFEVWVRESDLARARWILQSASEKHEQNPPEDRDAQKRGAHSVGSLEAIGVCPLCFGEFQTASSFCPNCGVPLRMGRPESDEDTGARSLCDLAHPQFVVELRAALQAARIPFNNSNYSAGDILTGLTGRFYVPSYEVLVLDSDFERATRTMAHVLQHWEFEPGAGFGLGRKPGKTFWPRRAAENYWQPRDLVVLLWSGANLASVDSIGMALWENQVPYRVDDAEHGAAKIFIHPDDEAGAREIVAQVVAGVPPD
jgi:hypothetical protein